MEQPVFGIHTTAEVPLLSTQCQAGFLIQVTLGVLVSLIASLVCENL